MRSTILLLLIPLFGGCYEERAMRQSDLRWIIDRAIVYRLDHETCPSMTNLAEQGYLELSPLQLQQVTIVCRGDYITLTTSNMASLTLRYRDGNVDSDNRVTSDRDRVSESE